MGRILVFSYLLSALIIRDCASFYNPRIPRSASSIRRNRLRHDGSRLFDSLDEGQPRRLESNSDYASSSSPQNCKEEWGLSRDYEKDFPSTVNQVVDEAFSAIAGTLYQTQKLDPNIASNAMSTSIFTQRPVRKIPDAGRIGIEIDGVEHLFSGARHRVSPSSGIRRVSLLLAAKLSRKESWESFEVNEDPVKVLDYRPVTVCFNTIKQALVASRDLKLLKLEHARGPGKSGVESPYENIKVQCVQDGIPDSLSLNRSRRRRNNGLSSGLVNATKGLLVVVQPTDYNMEHLPPGPAVHAVGDFQKLAAQAAVEEVPVVALSPRFLSNDFPYWEWDQSGYQKSSIYGGIEPPKGPTPWIMRDFSPPVFCWVGDALRLGRPSRNTDDCGEQCHLARVAVTQSVMDSGHSWQIFVAKECTHGKEKLPTEYIFLGSTRSASGRPTRAILKQILMDC
jgi:hypothetical protein